MPASSRSRRFKTTCLVAIVAFLVPVAPGTVGAEHAAADGSSADGGSSRYRFKGTERCLMRRLNRIRARRGLSRLERDKQLGYVARKHAREMAKARGVWHDQNASSEITRWRRLGQNTGRGQSCASLTRAFMGSSAHRAHILGTYRFFAVGTEWTGGRLYVQELFESRRDPGNIYHYP